jgi:hypothetical protein
VSVLLTLLGERELASPQDLLKSVIGVIAFSLGVSANTEDGLSESVGGVEQGPRRPVVVHIHTFLPFPFQTVERLC